MITEDEAFAVLSLEPEAGLEDIRRAYRRAALRYHPDRRPDDPEALRRFHLVSRAYRRAVEAVEARQRRKPPVAGPPLSPSDFALRGWERTAPPVATVEAVRGRDAAWLSRLGGQRVQVPTRDENRQFLKLWFVGMAISMVATVLLTRALYGRTGLEGVSGLGIVKLVGIALGTYAACLAASIYLILLTRRVVWLVARLRLGWQRALPGPASRERLDERGREKR